MSSNSWLRVSSSRTPIIRAGLENILLLIAPLWSGFIAMMLYDAGLNIYLTALTFVVMFGFWMRSYIKALVSLKVGKEELCVEMPVNHCLYKKSDIEWVSVSILGPWQLFKIRIKRNGSFTADSHSIVTVRTNWGTLEETRTKLLNELVNAGYTVKGNPAAYSRE